MASYFLLVNCDIVFSYSAFVNEGGEEGGPATSGTSKTEYFC